MNLSLLKFSVRGDRGTIYSINGQVLRSKTSELLSQAPIFRTSEAAHGCHTQNMLKNAFQHLLQRPLFAPRHPFQAVKAVAAGDEVEGGIQLFQRLPFGNRNRKAELF